MLYDIAVVGGGAAGLFAAITAKKLNNKLNIAVFEALDRVGKKLITTGNGQCNITNRYAEPRFYHSETPELLRYPLEAFTVNDTVKAFREIGVEIVFEADGRAYPASYQAGAVVDALRFTCEELGVEVICNAKVSSFSKKEYFSLKTEQGDFSAKKVILACGLLSGGAKLGSFGDTLRLLKESGYKAAKTTPAIVQLKTDTAVTRSLKGIKFSGEATLLENGKKVSKSSGEILFTDYGLSG
ncbi:MAG: aminoacetone oxidase family FAD-binding enzyme, partial [Clostridia bacterium]|nr:aminoacetone oxidase family FAD-binding enzyme [Clostridia bacterium]